jgi:hypothetical protein
MTQILPASEGRSNYLRVADAVSGMLGISREAFISQYKFYDNELKLLTPLQPSQSSYTLNPVRGLDSNVPSSFLMDKSDLFAVTGVGLAFTRATYASASNSLSQYGNYPEYSYPYAAVFTGSNEQTGLLNVVRGSVALSVNADQQWEIPADRMVFANQYINSQTQTIQIGGNDAHQGILNLNSIVIMDGENQNTLTVNLAQGGLLTNIDGNTNETTRNILCIRLIGFRIRNVANGGFSAANCRV